LVEDFLFGKWKHDGSKALGGAVRSGKESITRQGKRRKGIEGGGENSILA